MTSPTPNATALDFDDFQYYRARELKEGRFEGWGQAAWTRFLGEFIKFVCKGYRP